MTARELWEAHLAALATRARTALAAAQSVQELEELRVHLLGRKGELTLTLRELGQLAADERPAAGALANRVRAEVEQSLEERGQQIRARDLEQRLEAEAVDVTLPGRRPPRGHPHPLVLVRQEMEAIFASLGFAVAEGPEVESEWYNFEALNIPADHPAREMQDSFYVEGHPGADEPRGQLLLRTHTSPVQIRGMLAQQRALPVRIIAAGRVYRRDDDATHSPMFHQVEGLLVDRGVSFAHLKGILAEFARRLWGPRAAIRLRPSYFPFTEPSAEVDVWCVFCQGKGCRTCKGSGWIEILGAGMVHPSVLLAGGYDPEEVSGLAFGVGVERVAMLRYQIEDIRLLYEGDLRFLEQF